MRCPPRYPSPAACAKAPWRRQIRGAPAPEDGTDKAPFALLLGRGGVWRHTRRAVSRRPTFRGSLESVALLAGMLTLVACGGASRPARHGLTSPSRALAVAQSPRHMMLGRSVRGRPIRAIEVGGPGG